MSNPGAIVSETRSIQIEMEIRIDASKEKVWTAFVEEMDGWWLPDFRVTGDPKAVVFENKVGGRLYEDEGDGQGLLWFTILSLKHAESMHLSGQICPPFGGPATTILYLQFEDDGHGAMVLKVTNSLFGCVDESSAGPIREGWQYLFGQGLKSHVEGKNPAKARA